MNLNENFLLLIFEVLDILIEQRQTNAQVTLEFTKNTLKQTFCFDTLLNYDHVGKCTLDLEILEVYNYTLYTR